MTDNQNKNPEVGSSVSSTDEPKAEQDPEVGSSVSSTDEPKAEQEPEVGSSTSSTDEPKAEQNPAAGSLTSSKEEVKVEQKVSNEASDKNSKDWRRTEKEDKGYEKSEYKSPYGDKGAKQNKDGEDFTKNYDFSPDKGEKNVSKNNFLRNNIYQLNDLLETTNKNIDKFQTQKKHLNNLLDGVAVESREKSSRLSDLVEIEAKKQRYDKDLEEVNNQLQKLYGDRQEIEDAIKQKNNTSESEKSRDTEAEQVQIWELFSDEDPIVNTVLYVATFFPELNPQDFKRVVSLLLEDRVTNVSVKKSTSITEDNQTKTTEIYKQKKLAEIWQESFENLDKYLSNCCLKLYRKDGFQIIDFSSSKLRDKIRKHFEEDQFGYLDEQLRRTQQLDLFLDKSEKIADNAINLAVKIAVDYPDIYDREWLVEIFLKIVELVEKDERNDILLERLSRLIYGLQIDPNYAKSQSIAQDFLEPLIVPEHSQLAFLFIKNLIDKNLCSGWQGIQSAKQLLNWLRQLLDKKKYEGIESDIYQLLLELTWQSSFSSYLYDFLEILKEWLPKQDSSPEKYSPSNRASLFLLFDFCQDTILNFPYELYGDWPSLYPLFYSLSLDIDKLASNNANNQVNEKLDVLVSWLFHSAPGGEIAIKHVIEDIRPVEDIGFFLSEWHEILCEKEQNKEGYYLFKSLLQRIALLAKNSDHKEQNKAILFQQKQLIEYWTKLTDIFLNKAIDYENQGKKQEKIRFMNKRKQIKQLKQEFKKVQQEIKIDE